MSDFFKGVERLEVFSPLGYMMRMGAPEKLEVPDYKLLHNFVEASRFSDVLKYLESFHPQNIGMQYLLLEWSLQLPQTLKELTDSETERRETPKALAHFYEEIRELINEHGNHKEVQRSLNCVQSILSESHLLPPGADKFREQKASSESHLGLEMTSQMCENYEKLKMALKREEVKSAHQLLDHYYLSAVTNHDALVNFTNFYPSHIAQAINEPLAEELSNKSLAACPAYEALWSFIEKMNHRELAAFLAEHLRFHFAGENRQGQTRVIEDEDKIRLIFDPCGSGGAIRRRLGDDVYKLKEATESTWGRRNEVPYYCTHCALNEKKSIDTFGYPVMVTEFDPDPNKPCGWTVYKDPKNIPENIFTRVGRKKKI